MTKTAYFTSFDGGEYAVDISDGSEAWSVSTGSSSLEDVLVLNGTVFMIQGDLQARDASDGSLQWSGFSNVEAGPTVVNGDIVFPVATDDDIVRADPSDGSVVWEYTGASNLIESPVSADDEQIYASAEPTLHAFDYDGNQLWTFNHGGDSDTFSPNYSDSYVFVSSTDGYFYALNKNDGSIAWQASHNSSKIDGQGCNIQNGVVYYGSNDGKIYAWNESDGSVKWTFDTSADMAGAPVYSNGILFFTATNDTIYAVNESDGSQKWSSNVSTGLFRPRVPTVFDSQVIVGSDSSLFSFSESDGTENWEYSVPTNLSTRVTVVQSQSETSADNKVLQNIRNQESSPEKVYIGEVGSDAPIWKSKIVYGDEEKQVLIDNTNETSSSAYKPYADSSASSYIYADENNPMAVYDP